MVDPSQSPLSSVSKRAASKPKGAVRAKSGCYTCRIRRKKCDEKPDAEGSCQTCVRLRLQCLGFGAKRPDWMREGNSVVELRGKIKGFLAQNGMIKGHSASSRTQLPSSPPALSSPTSASAPPFAPAALSTPVSAVSTLAPLGDDAHARASASPTGPPSPHLGGSPPGGRHDLAPAGSSAAGVLVLSHGHPLPSPRAHAGSTSSASGTRIHSHGHGTRVPAPGRAHSRSPGSTYGAGCSSASVSGSNGGGGYLRNGQSASADAGGLGGYGMAGLSLDVAPLELEHHHLDTLDAMHAHSSSTLGAHPHSPYQLAPQLSPDSPAPSRPNGVLDVMLGYPAHSSGLHHGGHALAHQEHSVHPSHHGPQIQHGGHPSYHLQPMHGHGQAHAHHGGHGGNHTSSSWNNHIRPIKNGLVPEQHQQQQNQQSGQQQEQESANPYEEYQYPRFTHYNHTNESGAELRFPHASPTVRECGLPPPPLHSTFSMLYYADPASYGADDMDVELDSSARGLNIDSAFAEANVMAADANAVLPYYGHQAAGGIGAYAPYFSTEQQLLPTHSLYQPLTDSLFVDRGDGALVSHYLLHVRPVQYFFANPRVDDLLLRLAQSNPAVRDAICFVASVHQRRVRESCTGGGSVRGNATPSPPRGAALQLPANFGSAPESDERGTDYHARTRSALVCRADAGSDALTKGEAMAGLQCVSSFLFAGGVGEWDWFLAIAMRWVEAVLARARIAEPAHGEDLRAVLARMAREDELGAFIVRLTMWFEVLASVTQVRAPRFLDIYREVFGSAARARIVEVDGEPAAAEAEFSMLEVMGCNNMTFIALAEISALAAWKEEQTKLQMLSSVELVRRGSHIEERYLRAMYAESPTLTKYAEEGDSLEKRRRLTADIFRASARLYLHTVLSGDKPCVQEIVDGVRETVDALRRVPSEPTMLRRSVVRSVVFPICLAGCMTDDGEQRRMLKEVLESEGGAGNCGEVVKVMEAVWKLRRESARSGGRRAGAGGDVSWRDVLRDKGLPLLLV